SRSSACASSVWPLQERWGATHSREGPLGFGWSAASSSPCRRVVADPLVLTRPHLFLQEQIADRVPVPLDQLLLLQVIHREERRCCCVRIFVAFERRQNLHQVERLRSISSQELQDSFLERRLGRVARLHLLGRAR